MNETNKLTKTEEGPALHEVETSELQALTGGNALPYNEPPGCGFHPPGWHPPAWPPLKS